jgi:predicted cobalt transporter CbtA
MACSVRDLDGLIADAIATSGKYWIASILVGIIVICLEAYQKRWSAILALTIGLLIFHPHLTVRPFPMPSCEFMSIQASQAVLAVLVLMLGYRVIKILFAYRRTEQGRLRGERE